MDTMALIGRLRKLGVEPTDVEVKSGAGGLPTSVTETISAFANGTGGTLLVGVDEGAGFVPAAGFDAPAIRDALADACANKVEPPCRAPIEIEEVDGVLVVHLDVPELDPVEKPCFVSSRGTYGGSFIRGGDGDRRLSHYEVTQLLSNRSQPTFDRMAVPDATQADLDEDLVIAYLTRVRRSRGLRHDDRERFLTRLGVLTPDADGVLRPTLAGLLCFGEYPQQYFPQLFVSFVVLPTTRMGERSPDGRRFLDNKTITGPIPTIVADVVAMAIRNMRAGAIITGIGREDRYDYPLDVVRELVVNALMHRDYSPDARGAQVRVELYPDRLVVANAGGLFGPITVADLGSAAHRSTSRNQTMAALLADIELPGSRDEMLCENRGSGLLDVMAELRRVGMSPPKFDVRPGTVTVSIPQHALLAPEIVAWIGSLKLSALTDAQHLALAMMRATGRVTNAMLQAWGVDRTDAGRALKDLVQRGVAEISGGRRYASYHLVDDVGPVEHDPPAEPDQRKARPAGIEADLDAVMQAIRAGSTSPRALAARLGLSERTATRRLSVLVDRGLIAPLYPFRSSKQSYRIVDTEGH
ncbi:ATP-binding protein [Pseudonocardia sp.]|uniref:ATP-binding protein n=1 Tax=Pseudonocardia sp. TaxID=60912 RepID=UPI002632EAFE|nr:ATP-binding protein [Pseudonocardia sp.]